MTSEETANFLQIPRRTLQYLVQTGQVPFIRVSARNVRFSKSRLEQWVRSREGVELRYQKHQ